MKRSKVLLALAVVLVLFVSLWIHSHFNYPYAVYQYQQTGEVVEWFDRGAWLEVDALPIFVPDNPLWVDIIRKAAPITITVLFMAVLYFLVREKVRNTS